MNEEKKQSTDTEKPKAPEKKKPKSSHPEPRLAPGLRAENMLPFPSDPPVPNRAWTEMRLGRDIDTLSEEEKADLYIGHDPYL